jgi:hypothetical protein
MDTPAITALNNLTSTGVARKSASSGSSSSSIDTTYYDVKDLNHDGIVSAEEEYVYDLTHTRSSSKSLLTRYTSQGNLNTAANNTSSLIDIYV